MNYFFKHIVFFELFLYFPFFTYGHYTEFLYPIGPIEYETTMKICVLHQQGTYLELLLWDPVTKKAFKGLSHHTPAGLTILPSKKAFSFIDYQRIRIKEVAKKSPKALDLYPLYDFNLIHWIDDTHCYCSARERSHYHLFHITAQGDFFRLTEGDTFDYTYPQRVGDEFFYIKRNSAGKTTIEQTFYPEQAVKERIVSLCEELENIKNNEPSAYSNVTEGLLSPTETIYSCDEPDKNLSFLTMKNNFEGFFLKHIDHPFIERFAKTMKFEYWRFWKNNEKKWQNECLFCFELPLSLLYGEKRLYESGLRLCPTYNGNDELIYYVDVDGQGFLDLYYYRISDHAIKKISQLSSEHCFFSPCFYEGKMYFGGMLNEENSQLKMELTTFGEYQIDIPYVEI